MSYNMELVSSTSSTDDLIISQHGLAMQPPPTPQRTKRPQLSCNPCRQRKVKCDRVQPCTACSLHQIAEVCHYDLTENERHPILQAEALKEKDKEIVRLRREIERLGGQIIKSESPECGPMPRDVPKISLPPRVPRKPVNLRQRRLHTGDLADSIYFGAPGMASVIEEFANLSTKSKSGSLSYSVPRGMDMFEFQMAASHPFPTLWSAKDGTSSLVQLLPSKEDIFLLIEGFQCRAQSCSFPHLPEECTRREIERFLENVETNAQVHPDMLALLFSTLALGVHNAAYDRYGGKWVAGAMEDETKKGDVYVAAAMQALRLASFMNRPTLLVVETLVMIGPYLTNSGKFLDAWSLFGVTVRLAQSIGLHRDPTQLNPPAPLEEIMVRKNLWWWMLHMDQQYSMTLGRPLGISSIGDCPPPDPIVPDPVVQSLSNYIAQFSILSRQILSAGNLSNAQIDNFTDQLLALKATLPEVIQFDEKWLNPDKELPPWPLEAQAAVFYGKTHNYLVLLNRQRLENTRRDSNELAADNSKLPDPDTEKVPRGRERVLQSCRALLHFSHFFATRVRAAMICWTMGQQAFNAAMILTLNMLETGETGDLDAVQQAYTTFLEMNKLGIHKLAGAAVDKLGNLMKEREEEGPKETVMGKQGMLLLEDPGLQGFLPGAFTPLSFQMAGGAIPYSHANANANTGAGWAATSAAPTSGTEEVVGKSSKALGKRAQRRQVASARPSVPVRKALFKQSRNSAVQRQASDSVLFQRSPQKSSLVDMKMPTPMPKSVSAGVFDINTSMDILSNNSSQEVSPLLAQPASAPPQVSAYLFNTQPTQSSAQDASAYFPDAIQIDYDPASMFGSSSYPQSSQFSIPSSSNTAFHIVQPTMTQDNEAVGSMGQYQLQQHPSRPRYGYNEDIGLNYYDTSVAQAQAQAQVQSYPTITYDQAPVQTPAGYVQQPEAYPTLDAFHQQE